MLTGARVSVNDAFDPAVLSVHGDQLGWEGNALVLVHLLNLRHQRFKDKLGILQNKLHLKIWTSNTLEELCYNIPNSPQQLLFYQPCTGCLLI